jgi:hypothetical protein
MKASKVHSTYDDNDDDDHISERIQRFIKTLPSDDDDEFRISSTGQIVKQKHLHNDDYSNKKRSSGSNIRRWDDICSNQIGHYGSYSNVEQLTTRLICTALPYSTNNGVVAMISMIWGAAMYHFGHRYLQVAARSSKSNGTSPIAIDSIKDTSLTHDQKEQQKPVINTTGIVFSNDEDNQNSTPHLISEDNVNNSISDVVKPAGTPEPKATNTIIAYGSSTPMDDARQAVTLANVFEEACTEAGVACDRKMALRWAMQQQTTDKIIDAQQMEEVRRYVYDHSQRTVDRKLSQQFHDESIAASREDKDWQVKLANILDKCYSALIRSIYHCFAGMFVIVSARPVIFMIHSWYSLSSTDCYAMVQVHHLIQQSF